MCVIAAICNNGFHPEHSVYVQNRQAHARVPQSKRRNRRGATLVLVAASMVVLMGMAGLGVDMARMYSFKAQLKVLTDAAAHSGVLTLARDGTLADAQAAALARRTANPINKTLGTMAAADVVPGTWAPGSPGTFTAGAWATANAVKVTASYPANWTLARVFGVTNKTLGSSSVAAVGSTRSSRCLKPWAVPYSNLLQSLGHPATDTLHNLTEAQITSLKTNRTPVVFKITSNTDEGGGTVGPTVISGNYYAVRYGPVRNAAGVPYSPGPSSGAAKYRDAIEDLTCTAAGTARVGDWLDVENGNMKGPTLQGVRTLCGVSGGARTFACDANIVVPIWNARTTATGAANVQINYIGAFKLTNYDDGTVSGYLTSLTTDLAGGGGFQARPGPIKSIALVE
jgi:Flp pilus assembly protein TadG